MPDDNDDSHSSEKRQRILEGALKAFAEKGFYNTKVSEIADEAEVADGTIYLYFENKDDLLISLFEDRMEWIIDRLQKELEQVGGDVVDRFQRFIELHFQLAVENPYLAEFITVELRQSAKFIKEYDNPKFGDYLAIVKHLIEEGQEAGEFTEALDSRLVTRAVFGALDEVLLQMTLAETQRDEVEAEVEHITKLLVDGLRA